MKVNNFDLVPIDFNNAVSDTTSRDNVVMDPDDSVHIAFLEDVVYVRGEVFVPTPILYKRGASEIDARTPRRVDTTPMYFRRTLPPALEEHRRRSSEDVQRRVGRSARPWAMEQPWRQTAMDGNSGKRP